VVDGGARHFQVSRLGGGIFLFNSI